MAEVTHRPKLQSPKLLGIEAARGVAATLVVIYHAARHLEADGLGLPAFGGIETFGHAGVDFFFVLSGFIILFVHWGDLGRPSRLAHYAERRVTRIYPVYWAVMAVYVGIAILGSQSASLDAPTLAANVVLYPLVPDPILGVAWTLEHEMLFYLVFAVGILHRGAGALAVLGWVGLMCAGMAGVVDKGALGITDVASSAFNVQFLMGMTAAVVARRARLKLPLVVALVGTAAFSAIGIAESRGMLDGNADPARFLYGAAAFLVVIGLVERERTSGLYIPRVMGVLGKASYSIYLGHLLVIGVSYKVLDAVGLVDALPVWLTHVLLVLFGLIGGVMLSMLVEYPLMRFVRRFVKRPARA